MTNSTNKPNSTFWAVSIVALAWNIMGVSAYLGQAYMTDEALNLLSESEQLYYNNVPAWVTAAFALAVFAGVIGCLLLLFREKMATSLFFISLIAVLTNAVHSFFIQNDMPISGTNIIQPVAVIVISIFLVWYSKKITVKGWIS